MSKPVRKSVDMSAPPEERGRRREQGPVGGTPTAQMSRAQGSRGARWARDGARKFAATERPREEPPCYRAAIGVLVHGPGCYCSEPA
jgi:hypothetical protein